MKKLQSRLTLWPHQVEALALAHAYLRRVESSSSRPGAALVNIPTGGGKTPIIALLAHEGHKVERTLVLAPRVGIRDQLQLELSGTRTFGFFAKQGLTSTDLPRSVHVFESASDIRNAFAGDAIFVSTLQLIDQFRRERPSQFADFADTIDLLLVDEGHYEPARSWSLTIRGFGGPAVLFTATPYRNDLRAFDIDGAAIYVARFTDLERERLVRSVKVVLSNSDNSPAGFVDSVLQAFQKQYGAPPDSARKLIVRCERKDDVAKIGRAFVQKGLTVVGLHEGFTRADTAADPWKRRSPDDPEIPGAPAIWVHQHKLLEGVDGPSFRAVAMYGPLGSVRALVQQVGRTIRNPGRKANETALLLDHRAGRVASNWNRFLLYDADLMPGNLLRGAPDIVRESLEQLPRLDYIAESFRTRFDLGGSIDVSAEISVPTSAYFLETTPSFQLPAFLNGKTYELQERALAHRHFPLDSNRHVLLYIAWRNSPLLREHYFVELALHAILIRNFKDHLAYLDTGGGAPIRDEDLEVGGPMRRDQLSRLMSRKGRTRITGVTTRNAALGPRAVRLRHCSAASLSDTAQFLDDFQHVATSMTGVSSEAWRPKNGATNNDEYGDGSRRGLVTARRYLGLGRGHISEMGPRLPVGEYFKWVDAVDRRLLSRQAPVDLFDRYARALSTVPRAPDPRNILLDLEEAREVYRTLDRGGLRAGQPLELEDACSDCKKESAGEPRAFEVRGHGIRFKGSLLYDRAMRRYIIESRDLAESFHYVDDRPGPDLVTFLNSRQAFSILPETTSVLYADGTFFSPAISVGKDFDAGRFPMGKVLTTYPELGQILSEKGDKALLKANPAGWHPQSVFGWFDANLDGVLDRPSLVVCDDMGTESADFIALDRNEGRVVLVHCKARTARSKYGASALHEVCSQAVKNCGTLSLFNPLKPRNVKRWHEPWYSSVVAGSVQSRVRRGAPRTMTNGYGELLWERFGMRITDPNVEREVWLVLGSTLSKRAWESELKKDDPAPEAIQTTHLLLSTLASIGGANARLRILCSP